MSALGSIDPDGEGVPFIFNWWCEYSEYSIVSGRRSTKPCWSDSVSANVLSNTSANGGILSVPTAQLNVTERIDNEDDAYMFFVNVSKGARSAIASLVIVTTTNEVPEFSITSPQLESLSHFSPAHRLVLIADLPEALRNVPLTMRWLCTTQNMDMSLSSQFATPVNSRILVVRPNMLRGMMCDV